MLLGLIAANCTFLAGNGVEFVLSSIIPHSDPSALQLAHAASLSYDSVRS